MHYMPILQCQSHKEEQNDLNFNFLLIVNIKVNNIIIFTFLVRVLNLAAIIRIYLFA